MTDLQIGWDAHRAAQFPAEGRGREVGGVDLVLVDSIAAGAIQTFVNSGTLDPPRAEALAGAIVALEHGVPLLGGEPAVYFGRLLTLAREVMKRAKPV